MNEQSRLRWLLSLLVVVVLMRFAWIPLANRIRTQSSHLKYLKQISEINKQPLNTSTMAVGESLSNLEYEWEQLESKMYQASSPLEAGMSMLDHARKHGIQMGIDIRSSLLLPSVPVENDLHVVSSDITSSGSFLAVLDFFHVLSHGVLGHKISGLTIEKTLTESVTTTFRLSALAKITGEDSVSAGGLTLNWRLSGIIHQPDKATALLVHTLTGAETFVNVGDKLGENDWIVEVGVDFVRVSDGHEEITLTMGL